MSSNRKRGRPVAVSPEEVLERAVALFCAEGVEALSLNSLCVELGISKPALYRSFGGEDGLHRAALAHYFSAWMGPRFGQIDFTQPFPAQCEQLAKMISEPDLQSPQTKGCLYTRMRLSRWALGEKSNSLVVELEGKMMAQLVAWMEGMAQSGQLKRGLAAADAAAYVDAQVMLAIIQHGQGGDGTAIAARLQLALSVLHA